MERSSPGMAKDGTSVPVTTRASNRLTDTWLENLPTRPADHSVSVDPVTGEVFVPFGGIAGNTECPGGCVAVFAEVPEPSSLPLLFTAVVGLLGFGAHRRWRRA